MAGTHAGGLKCPPAQNAWRGHTQGGPKTHLRAKRACTQSQQQHTCTLRRRRRGRQACRAVNPGPPPWHSVRAPCQASRACAASGCRFAPCAAPRRKHCTVSRCTCRTTRPRWRRPQDNDGNRCRARPATRWHTTRPTKSGKRLRAGAPSSATQSPVRSSPVCGQGAPPRG